MYENSTGPVLDHIVLAARRREGIDAQLAELGLTPGSERAIPGTGLSNVVVAVGSQLLEVHYPDGTPVAEGAPPYARVQQQALAATPEVALVPVAWVVRYGTEGQLREVSTRVGYPVIERPAEPPNNAPYLMGGFGAAFDRPWLPMFIHWTHAPHVPPALAGNQGEAPDDGWLTLDMSAPDRPARCECGSTTPMPNRGPSACRRRPRDRGATDAPREGPGRYSSVFVVVAVVHRVPVSIVDVIDVVTVGHRHVTTPVTMSVLGGVALVPLPVVFTVQMSIVDIVDVFTVRHRHVTTAITVGVGVRRMLGVNGGHCSVSLVVDFEPIHENMAMY